MIFTVQTARALERFGAIHALAGAFAESDRDVIGFGF
jgi:hypothetical protein